jgi:NAD+ diphosphatase
MKYCPECGSDLAAAEVDGRERLRCTSDDCPFVFWDNPTPVVAAIVELDGQIVLTRKDGWPPKMYGVVAGFLEKGETVAASILREVREELGLDGEIVEFVGYYSFFERNQVILAFHVWAEGEIVIGEELSEVKLVPRDKLRPWSVGTGPAVRDWLARKKTGIST